MRLERFLEPPTSAKRLLFVKLPIFQYLQELQLGPGAMIPMYCQYLLESLSIFKINTCWDPIQSFYRALTVYLPPGRPVHDSTAP